MKLRCVKIMLSAVILAATVLLTSCNMFGQQTSAILDYDFSEMRFIQLEEPQEGSRLATISTSFGDIKLILYPEYAPNTVQNFINRAEEGFYDNKPIFGVQNDIYFLSGALSDDGKVGATDDGEYIENEYSVDLWAFKGALMSFTEKMGYGDSRFFIVDNYEFTEENAEELRSLKDENDVQRIPERLIEAFRENEGVFTLSGVYTVFGQTIEGFDVIDKITSVEVDEKTLAPIEPIYVNKVTISEYTGS